jgi:hypothetical protein
MRRSYIEMHCSLRSAFELARRWAGSTPTTLMAPSTSAVTSSPWLEGSGVPIGSVGNRHSRFNARPRGIIIGWCLHLDEVLELERHNDLTGMVLVRAFDQHAPWITAHRAEHIGGDFVAAVDEAEPAIKATVEGLSMIAVRNQGLIDSRERSTVVQALTYLRSRGHELVPEQLATEAIRLQWPGQAPLELAEVARKLNAGKQLRFERRLDPEALERWERGNAR